jgi:hypothetical protein
MTRTLQTVATPARSAVIACIGDSHTFNATLGNVATDFHPGQTQKTLRAGSTTGTIFAALPKVLIRNFGISGNTTGQMVARQAVLTRFEVPKIVVIYGGTNDAQYATTVQAGSTASVVNVAAGFGANYQPGSYLLVNGVSRQIASVATDAITLVTALGGAPTAGQAVALDTQTNLQTIATFAIAAGCNRLIIVGQHYFNFSTGGDTTTTPLAGNATLRTLQQAAATAVGATYVDAYAYFRGLIVAGTETQGSFSWHVFDSNPHLNPLGERYLAASYLSSIVGQPTWLAALT